MSDTRQGMTRRDFLQRLGAAGGAAALYETMTVLGLINLPTAWAGPVRLPAESGKGKKVLVLGAGVGGLAAAYSLVQAGYACTVLEAQDRPGGRSLTARRGSVIIEDHPEHGELRQVCQFDEGEYLNMGPGRIPYHHRRVIHACRELGVALEVYIMQTTANLFQGPKAFEGQAVAGGRITHDTRGYIAELLSKAIDRGALDQRLNAADRERLKDLLRVFGDLDCGRYRGSTRSGCAHPPNVHRGCKPEEALGLDDLLQGEFWRHHFYQPQDSLWQPTLFQPVGGMDKIVHAYAAHLGDRIHYQAVVEGLQLTDEGVEVSYRHETGNSRAKLKADYCISNIPLPILSRIPGNYAPDFIRAVQRAHFAPTCKVGWQAEARFWESDRYAIYGGISWTDDIITQIWYPSYGYFGAKGTLTGAYNFAEDAERLGDMSLAQRLQTARAGARRLHPEFRTKSGLVPNETGMSIAWHYVRHQEGGWAQWQAGDAADRRAYERLLSPDRRLHIVGDQVSTLPGWQEGALMSAEHVVSQIGGLPIDKPELIEVPETDKLIHGLF